MMIVLLLAKPKCHDNFHCVISSSKRQKVKNAGYLAENNIMSEVEKLKQAERKRKKIFSRNGIK